MHTALIRNSNKLSCYVNEKSFFNEDIRFFPFDSKWKFGFATRQSKLFKLRYQFLTLMYTK